MALTEETEIYECLIRFENGAVKGMHVQYIEKIFKDGKLVAANPSNAQKVAVLDGDTVGLNLVGKILPKVALAQQKAIDNRDATIVQKQKDVADRDAIIEQKNIDIGQRETVIGTRDLTIKANQKDIDDKDLLISEKNLAINVKDADIVQKQKDLASRDATIKTKQAEIDKLEAEKLAAKG